MGGFSMFQAFIYLLAAIVCVPIAKRSGLGSVLGYLIAGVLIGPYVLGPFLGLSSGESGEDIMHAAEFGVVMMLFLVGLELDPNEFWKMRKKIVGIGSIQLFGTILLIMPICFHYLNLGFGTSLAIGSAVAMSSTAIILQTLSEKGLTKTPSGQSSFAVLLFQDIMVIPILAILPLLAVNATIVTEHAHDTLLDGAPGWMKTLAILSAIGIIFFVGNYIVNPFFKYIARLQVRELFTSFALMLVIGVSVLMTYVGLSPALGAFMAGVALANSQYKHQLESDIEPFKALLLGLFFIAVGSTINFNLIIDDPLTILFMTLGIMTIKAIVLLVAGWIFKLKLTQNILFVMLLSQIGEFAFVILNLTNQLQLIPKEWHDLLLATTAVTMTITPILLMINEKWIAPLIGMRKRKFAEEIEYDLPESHKKIIIAGYGDFGNTIGRIVKFSGFQATVLDNDSDRVNLLRKMGFKVYYGDATNLNVLRAAKADEAHILVAAIDPPEINKRLIETAKEHFPNLKILVRARNRFEAYEFINDGFDKVYRETFYTALQAGVDCLELLGVSHEDAVRQGEIFKVAEKASLKKLSKHSHNLEEYITVSREETERIRALLNEGMNLELVEDEIEEEDSEKR
ncbi:monovalent cation:proton antiporter-2 (CPA2) family protein [Moheibacter sediminis]|uniref:Kef-type potassium/proton antiporter, CPA2 family n=1 Tax=Moheibacter sediminis TaxID=1434700 RepID=A0A1W1Y805_9FLAO|nr:monovalent cation:proton antiporter-2 (CPA2) family protein [Moheibacter sediminis]SMC31951.1 Kef-type potassium/proton antiporter, CPA2 family [Moheibacter sediminis]